MLRVAGIARYASPLWQKNTIRRNTSVFTFGVHRQVRTFRYTRRQENEQGLLFEGCEFDKNDHAGGERKVFQEVVEDVWMLAAPEDGPSVTILGGVHGNEKAGVEVVKRIAGILRTTPTNIAFGTLTLGIGNPQAVREGKRWSEGGVDLNRSFGVPKNLSESEREDGPYELRRARQLRPLLSSTDILVDIHATNKPSVAFARVGGKYRHAHEELISMLDTDVVLCDPEHTLGQGMPVASDEYVNISGGVGVCLETGQADETEAVENIFRCIMSIIHLKLELTNYDVDSLKLDPAPPLGPFYEMKEVFIMPEAGFEWAEGMGTHNFQELKKGQKIGLVPGSGKDRKVVKAKQDCVLVFPKIPELLYVGSPVYWLAEEIKPKEPEPMQ
eukprot:Clim_evm73s134 gene=Clim_evmTU73s134